jgi:hypothetical protein
MIRFRTLLAGLLAAGVTVGVVAGAVAAPSGRLMVYTSQPSDQMAKVVEAFRKAHPDVRVELFRSGTTEVMNKLQAEFAAGRPQAGPRRTAPRPRRKRRRGAAAAPDGGATLCPGGAAGRSCSVAPMSVVRAHYRAAYRWAHDELPAPAGWLLAAWNVLGRPAANGSLSMNLTTEQSGGVSIVRVAVPYLDKAVVRVPPVPQAGQKRRPGLDADMPGRADAPADARGGIHSTAHGALSPVPLVLSLP